jgi:hypothetical protein
MQVESPWHASWQQVLSQEELLPQAEAQHDPVHGPMQFAIHVGSLPH